MLSISESFCPPQSVSFSEQFETFTSTKFELSFSLVSVLGASMDLMSTSRVAEQIKVGRGGGEKKCNTVDNLSLKGLLCNQ